MPEPIVVACGDSDLAKTRFPPALPPEHGGTPLVFVDAGETPPAAHVVLDSVPADTARHWLGQNISALVDVATLDQLLADGWDPASARALWRPFLPYRHSVDVREAHQVVASGALGNPTHVELLSAIDQGGRSAETDPSHPGVRSRLEADVYGLDLIEFLLGFQVVSARQRGAAVMDYAFDDEMSATHVLIDSALSSAPGFSLSVVADQGRLLLRSEWAPGDLVVRERGAGWTAKAVARPKPNLQAANTIRGGWETVELLVETLSRQQADADCARALRLLGQAPCRRAHGTRLV